MSHSPSLTPGSRRSRLALAALATLALALSSSPVLAFTNWLANSSFESNSFSGWVVYGSRAVESTNGTYYNGGNPGGSNVLSHSGAYVGKTWGQFNNVDNYNGCYQDVPASADSVWSADAWALTHQQDLLSGGNEFWLEVSFRDTYNTILGTYTSQVLNTNTMVPNTWAHLTVTNEVGSTNLTAPYGTAVARCQVVFHQPGGYYPGGSAYFDDINLIRTSAPDPDITFPPTDQTKVVGQTATFTVVASGKSTLTYKWQKYGQDLSNGGRISGATSPTLTIANLTVDDMAYYTVVVTDNAGSLSQGVNLTVLDPGIITGPVSQKKVEGETATLTVVAGGATALAYKWQKDGNDLANGGTISGATSATLTLANLTVADSGNYTVVVSDNGGTVTSEAATLTVVSAAQASNLLLNRGFESGADAPWSRFNGGGLATTNNNYYQTTEPVRVYD
ncbi:MAG TPA: immunoglobulin domain-containing protein, partial [Candidatus Sulfotelmatobacter sp.]|nr:immunoglobulin domain-containing protein [Candidatus Sulfotelmatobacter sp.]